MTVLRLADENATCALAARLAALARSGDVLALWGGLGAGKTVFARAFVRALSDADAEVPSPTFTLVQTYDPVGPGAVEIFHFDLFRLDRAEDALELGLDDALADGVSLIEWPERLGSLLPGRRLDVTFREVAGDVGARDVALGGHADWTRRLAEAGLER